jgi:hypothetical protein
MNDDHPQTKDSEQTDMIVDLLTQLQNKTIETATKSPDKGHNDNELFEAIFIKVEKALDIVDEKAPNEGEETENNAQNESIDSDGKEDMDQENAESNQENLGEAASEINEPMQTEDNDESCNTDNQLDASEAAKVTETNAELSAQSECTETSERSKTTNISPSKKEGQQAESTIEQNEVPSHISPDVSEVPHSQTEKEPESSEETERSKTTNVASINIQEREPDIQLPEVVPRLQPNVPEMSHTPVTREKEQEVVDTVSKMTINQGPSINIQPIEVPSNSRTDEFSIGSLPTGLDANRLVMEFVSNLRKAEDILEAAIQINRQSVNLLKETTTKASQLLALFSQMDCGVNLQSTTAAEQHNSSSTSQINKVI